MHNGSDSTAYSNENGQLEVGLLQINIDAVRFWYAPTQLEGLNKKEAMQC